MKKALLIIAALMMVSTVAIAGPTTYMGLYADEGHSECSFYSPAPYTQVTMYIYIFPSDVGMKLAEFAIVYPTNVIALTATPNSDITLSNGTLEGGISVNFGNCHQEPVWTHTQGLLVMDSNPSVVELVYDPGLPAGKQYLTIASCEEGFPTYEAVLLNNLYLNQECVIANEETSWGAIKDLYK